MSSNYFRIKIQKKDKLKETIQPFTLKDFNKGVCFLKKTNKIEVKSKYKENLENDQNNGNLDKKLLLIGVNKNRNSLDKFETKKLGVNSLNHELKPETEKQGRNELQHFKKSVENFDIKKNDYKEEFRLLSLTNEENSKNEDETAQPKTFRSFSIRTNQIKVLKDNFFQKKSKNSKTPSQNLSNILINIEKKPKFSQDEYRFMYTNLIKAEYFNIILSNLKSEEETYENCLESHKISERMRSRMIDWMIEVLNNYKCNEYTFFIAISIMDKFFKLSKRSLPGSELHLIGVTSMFIASKYSEIYPLRLKIVQEKICHKKIPTEEIVKMESEIASILNYTYGKPTIWEFITFYIEELFFIHENNFHIKDKSLLEINSAINNRNSLNAEFPTGLYTLNMLKLLNLTSIYLSKMNVHDYHLLNKKPSVLAASTIYVSLKICEQINKEEYVNEFFVKRVSEISGHSQSDIVKLAQKILYNAQNFESIFPGLENLKKIHFTPILDLEVTK